MDQLFRGTIGNLREGRGKKRELTNGLIARSSVTDANGHKLTRDERDQVPAKGLFVHRSQCAKGAFADGAVVLFNIADDGQRPMAVDVMLAPVVVVTEPDLVSALEPAAIARPVEKAPAQPVFVREAVKVDSSNLVEEQPPLAGYVYETPSGGLEALYTRIEEDPEARLKGVEAVLESADSKATSSSETAWATIWPAVVGLGKILWQLLLGAFDLVRFVGKQLLGYWRARKSAA